ncbi:hypothetical protein BDB01DRAFT_839318 [Pilobolus umbonatus]|nr:hypothetical protein BDB01DRAFT_839318 [Pilobolus umbonatus]
MHTVIPLGVTDLPAILLISPQLTGIGCGIQSTGICYLTHTAHWHMMLRLDRWNMVFSSHSRFGIWCRSRSHILNPHSPLSNYIDIEGSVAAIAADIQPRMSVNNFKVDDQSFE